MHTKTKQKNPDTIFHVFIVKTFKNSIFNSELLNSANGDAMQSKALQNVLMKPTRKHLHTHACIYRLGSSNS